MSSPVWFITGCSSGFGASLALHALRSGHRVIATSRNPAKTPELVSQVKQLGGEWHTLDVCSPERELKKVVERATDVYGRIDILVNCAGYALLGAFEILSDEECRAQMNTNFFGPAAIVRLVLPAMRQRRSGTIVNFSSTAGTEARASRALYSSSKWALEAMSEALYEEVKPLGIRVLIVSPGAFRSNFAASCISPKTAIPEEYKGTITDQIMERVRLMHAGSGPNLALGDVEKGVQGVFDMVTKSGQAQGMDEFLRLPLGRDGIARWQIKLEDLQRTIDGTEKIWSSTDAD